MVQLLSISTTFILFYIRKKEREEKKEEEREHGEGRRGWLAAFI
jgi:hypothetical protein